MQTGVDVSVRELRNHTKAVVERIESGTTMFLTKHGRRITTITALHAPSWSDIVDDVLDGEPYDSGVQSILDVADVESGAFADDHLDGR